MSTRLPAPIPRGEIAELLRDHGIAPTHQRIEIASVLFSRREHLSADQLLTIVNAHYSEVSKATVYNTLRLFLEKKLIREVIVDPSRVFYRAASSLLQHGQRRVDRYLRRQSPTRRDAHAARGHGGGQHRHHRPNPPRPVSIGSISPHPPGRRVTAA